MEKDVRRAASLYEKACQGGDAQGCNNLGVMYKQGTGVKKDKRRAAQLFKQACGGGYTEACKAR
ncbi:tetratricopeptide repeat protein [Archangium sp.]|uniref:tetratricopeptide repeat protein n=1 Tax=Archangium sp. TaxID=1872627 RepID=UPI00389A6ADD